MRYTRNVSNRAALRIPWLSTHAISRQSSTANRFTTYVPGATPSGSVPGAPSIHSGSDIPRNPSRSLKYPEIPIATTATIAVYSSSRSQPMNQAANSPSTTYP